MTARGAIVQNNRYRLRLRLDIHANDRGRPQGRLDGGRHDTGNTPGQGVRGRERRDGSLADSGRDGLGVALSWNPALVRFSRFRTPTLRLWSHGEGDRRTCAGRFLSHPIGTGPPRRERGYG